MIKFGSWFSFYKSSKNHIANEILMNIIALWKEKQHANKNQFYFPDARYKETDKIAYEEKLKSTLEEALFAVINFDIFNKLSTEEKTNIINSITITLSKLAENSTSSFSIEEYSSFGCGYEKKIKMSSGLCYSVIDKYDIYGPIDYEFTCINFPECFKDNDLLKQNIFDAIKDFDYRGLVMEECSIELKSL